MKTASLESRALALLEDALDQPEAERDAWVSAQTAGEPALAARVAQLLKGAQEADQLLTGGAPTESVETAPPERVGAYRITELLGRGGMGAVYKAVRDSGDFDHVVAIKLIRPGALSSALVERFKRERQILAELAHPNIARLFDGGTTVNGEPFIVMEYVDGSPITEWAEARRLDIPARLRLFLKICGAVGFAHQNLIIHRDITPPNVLVTPEGEVKLIDFGISRPQDDQPELLPGSITGLSLTPRFAAPERLAGGGATTLSDIYSLGRLLEALVAGCAPDDDLKAIISEATAAEPEKRYASVDGLADDIERYLSGRTVAARRGGRRYAIGKFVGRYKAAVGASAAALAMIVAALVVAVVSFVGAERARAAEAQRFEQVRTLAGYMLFDLTDRLARTPGNTAARVALAAKAQTYLSALAASPGAEPRLRLETVRGLLRLARIQGVPPEPNFGDWDKAKANIASADAILADLSGGDIPAAELAPDLARADVYRGLITGLSDNKIAEADAALAAAEGHLDAVAPAARKDAWHLVRADLRRAQAEVRYLAQEDAKIGEIAGVMDAELRDWPAELRQGRAGQEAAAWADYQRAVAVSALNGGDFGIPAMQAARRRLLELDARWPNDPGTLYALVYTDYMLFAAAARADQQDLSSRSLVSARERLAQLLALEDSDNSLKTLDANLAEAYAQDLANRGRFPEAIAAQRESIARVSARLASGRSAKTLADLGWNEMMLGLIGRKAGDRNLACASWTRAKAYFDEVAQRQELTGFHAGFQAGLSANLAKCAAGRPASEFGPLS